MKRFETSIVNILGILCLLIGTAGRLSAAEPAPAPPDLTQGGKPDKNHDWLLGPTGARGWIFFRHEDQTAASRQILITAVDAGSPADGVLRVNDVILGVNGKPFADDARKSFGRAITAAEEEDRRAAADPLAGGAEHERGTEAGGAGHVQRHRTVRLPEVEEDLRARLPAHRKRRSETGRHTHGPQRVGAAGQRQGAIPPHAGRLRQEGGGIAQAGHVELVLRLWEPVLGRVCPGHRRPVDRAGTQTHYDGSGEGPVHERDVGAPLRPCRTAIRKATAA